MVVRIQVLCYNLINLYNIIWIKKNKITEVSRMKKYECPCGYVYDPEVGDPDNGIEPGTAFEDLPEDWSCPVCGLEKDAFTEI